MTDPLAADIPFDPRTGWDPEAVARTFHETYERLAPSHDYTTRRASAVPWEWVPENNRALMVDVAAEVLDRLVHAVKTYVADRQPCESVQVDDDLPDDMEPIR